MGEATLNNIIDDNQPAGGYINSIEFNNGQTIELKKNDIVIFVGPNNAGKSQSLKDINNLYGENVGLPVVIKEITTKKSNKEKIKTLLSSFAVEKHHDNYSDYMGFGFSFNSYNFLIYENQYSFKDMKNLFLSYLNTENRLTASNPAQTLNRDEPKNHPIHYVASDKMCRERISSDFEKAFGKKIVPNILFGRTIPLCLTDDNLFESINEKNDFISQQYDFASELEKYPHIENQGDGIRSFCGIVLNLIIPHYRTFLIDEPESFLHPPQANIMGKVIGESLSENQQAFISTHSQEIIKGLIDTCPERIKIVRITRSENVNQFSILNNEDFDTIWKDPLLKYSDIMSGIFYNHVILCESDSDCKFYSIIYNEIRSEENKYSDVLFVHCGGKQRLQKVIKALKALGVSLIVVPDIDILNDENTLRTTIEAVGGDWNVFSRDYNVIHSNFENSGKKIDRDSLKRQIDDVLKASADKEMSKIELDKISSFLKCESKWSVIKKYGEDGFPAGDCKKSYNMLKQEMNTLGIFPVPVGELECFVKEVGGHGPEWVNQVLENYPVFSHEVYKQVKEFVKSWGI